MSSTPGCNTEFKNACRVTGVVQKDAIARIRKMSAASPHMFWDRVEQIKFKSHCIWCARATIANINMPNRSKRTIQYYKDNKFIKLITPKKAQKLYNEARAAGTPADLTEGHWLEIGLCYCSKCGGSRGQHSPYCPRSK